MAQPFDFKSLEEPFEVEWPVTVHEPAAGGGTQEREFTARFRVISDEEAQKLIHAPPKRDPLAFFRATFVGLGPAHGELTPELFSKILSRPYARQGVLMAYFRCAQGAPARG